MHACIRMYTRKKICWPTAEKLKEYIRAYRMMKQATDGAKNGEKSKFKKKYWILIRIYR